MTNTRTMQEIEALNLAPEEIRSALDFLMKEQRKKTQADSIAVASLLIAQLRVLRKPDLLTIAEHIHLKLLEEKA